MSTYSRFFHIFIFLLLFCSISQNLSFALEKKQALKKDDTMLLFVGEQVDILSIASRREESASKAPAVAQVISRDDFQDHGLQTLSQVLERTPGFYMAQKEWGSLPYLRGMPNSVLFLYDTVPIVSDTRKSLHQLDYDLSLAPVKKIEIVRGPSSVLWGPDAFGGVVNVVPLTGGDIDGLETGLMGGAGDVEKGGFYLNMGKKMPYWDGFLSLSGSRIDEDDHKANLVHFFGNNGNRPVPPDDRLGSASIGQSHFVEAYGKLAYRDWLTISGRFSDNEKPYSIEGPNKEFLWEESRSMPFSYLKAEASRKIDPDTALRFTGYYSNLRPEFEIIDKTLDQQEQTAYGELIFDQTFFTGQGLFTGGVSYRKKDIKDAPVWDSFMPDFLEPENEFFLPLVDLEDYEADLWSVFGQYTHKFKNIDFIVGFRGDLHDPYEDQVSFNTGIVWHPNSKWQTKFLYGTAYRTPFARQIQEEEHPDLEKIETFTAQFSWMPDKDLNLSLTGFWNQLEDHVIGDPYAGLSEPNNQDIYGLEMKGSYSPLNNIRLKADLTLLDNNGPDEHFRFEESSIVHPDGTVETKYSDFSMPFNEGPDTMFNFTADWWPKENIMASLFLRYISSRKLIYPKEEVIESASDVWRLDASFTFKDIVKEGLDLNLYFQNLLDKDYHTPGTYSMIGGDSFQANLELRYHF